MTAELWSLFGCAILLAISITIQAVHLDIYAGLKHTAGNRDSAPIDLSPLGKRLSSNVTNLVEGMAMLVPLILIIETVALHSNWTTVGAVLYFISRALYVVCYIFGVTIFRSVFWVIGMGALSSLTFGVILAVL